MSKKITLFLSDLSGGGAEKVFVNLAHGLLDLGYNIDFVLARAVGPYIRQLDEKINLIDLKSTKLLLSLPKLHQYLKQANSSLIISGLEDTNLIALCAKVSVNNNTPLIVTVHNALTHEIRHSNSLKRKLVPYLLPFFYSMVDAVVAVSNGVSSDLQKLGVKDNKIQVIYNPIVNSKLLSKASSEILHPWFSKKAKVPVILGVGRLTEQKDFRTLLRAFALVLKEKTCRLMILGEGSELTNLVELGEYLGLSLNKDFCFPGFTQNPYAYMSQASMLVLSSKWEGFGNVLVEAMAVGTPVVATDCNYGPNEILVDGEYGELVPVENPQEMSLAILRTLEMPCPRDRLQARALDFSEKIIAQKYIQLASKFSPDLSAKI